jgi:hypothetical protein
LIRLGRSWKATGGCQFLGDGTSGHAEPDAGGARGASAAGDRPAREWADL